MPFGVELPENLGQTTSESVAPETTEAAPDPEVKDLAEASKPEAPSELTDLDKLERFRFEGREWSPKDLKNAYMARQDYSRKTAELSEARKYADNFETDLQTVLKSPERLSDLRAVYPESYVKIAERIIEAQKSGSLTAPKPESEAKPALPREMQELLDWKNQVEKQSEESRIQFIQSKLDQDFEKFGKAYPFADAETVNARAEFFVKSNPDKEFTPKVLENFFKAHHEQQKQLFEKHYQDKVEQQKRAGFRAKDAGPGGSTPGSAPKRPKTIQEAKHQWLSDIEASQ